MSSRAAGRNAIILVAVQDGQAVKLAKLVEFLGFDDVPNQLGGDELRHSSLAIDASSRIGSFSSVGCG